MTGGLIFENNINYVAELYIYNNDKSIEFGGKVELNNGDGEDLIHLTSKKIMEGKKISVIAMKDENDNVGTPITGYLQIEFNYRENSFKGKIEPNLDRMNITFTNQRD